jgi:hypothetical protein
MPDLFDPALRQSPIRAVSEMLIEPRPHFHIPYKRKHSGFGTRVSYMGADGLEPPTSRM